MNIKLFEAITDNQKILNSFEQMEFKKGEIIFREKEKNEYLFYLLKGKVSLYANSTQGKRKLFFTIDEDNIINDFDFNYSNTPYEAIAFEACVILKIKQDEFLEQCTFNNQLLFNALKLQAHRTRRLYRQLKNTVSINIEKKIAAKLWKLAKDYGIVYDDGYVLIDFKLSNTYIADIIGCSRESVSRAMQELVKLDLVKLSDREYIVKQNELLKYYRD